MLRPITLTAAVAAVLAVAPAAQARAPRALLVTCDQGARAAVFEGRMDSVTGAARMGMRFRLQTVQPGDAAWRRVGVPGFGGWVTSDPGRARLVFTRRVEHLLGPASYRVQVRFRWLDATGAAIADTVVTSRACRQPDPRPDLEVDAIDIGPATVAGSRRYLVTVRNSGRSSAPASTVALDLGAGAPLTAAVSALGPGAHATVAFTAPACASGTAVAGTADVADVVDESDESNDVLTAGCP
jgi:hypothetical protein